MNAVLLKEGERVDDLMRGGLRIIQSRSTYSFGLDAVLLAHYVRARPHDRLIDLGTGNGVIPILLSHLTRSREIIGVEIQEDLADMAIRSIEMNGLSERVKVVKGDMMKAPETFGESSFDVVVSNPPYMKSGSGAINPRTPLAIARHEIACTLEQVLQTSVRLLRQRGRIYLVHRADRFVDLLCSMRNENLEPKRARMVHPAPKRPPNLVLVEGVKGARPGILFAAPLYVYEEGGDFSDEMRGIYGCRSVEC